MKACGPGGVAGLASPSEAVVSSAAASPLKWSCMLSVEGPCVKT